MRDYQPITLLKTRTYPAYQFHAELQYKGQSVEKCMAYTVLLIMDWLRKKIGASPCPHELDTQSPEEFDQVDPHMFSSFHINEGFSVDITSLPDEGIWALQIKEPETNQEARMAVIGRFYVTDVGLKVHNQYVELGVRINVLDPVGAQEEVDFAFRPAFLRQLFACRKLCISHIDPLYFNRCENINSLYSMQKLFNLIQHPDNSLPSVVFTYVIEQKKVKDLVDKLDAVLGLKNQPDSFASRLSQLSDVPENLAFGNCILPYDADYVAYQICGYGRSFILSDKQFSSFAALIKEPVSPGDVVIIEPACFGGAIQVVPYNPRLSGPGRERIRGEVIHSIQAYSKHKRISFGNVVFENAARRLEVENRIKARIHAQQDGEQQRIDNIYAETEELLAAYDQEKKTLLVELESMREDLRNHITQISKLEDKIRRIGKDQNTHENNRLRLQMPEIKELYTDEIRDLVISILQSVQGQYRPDGSRAEEILSALLQENTITGEGKAIFERFKTILFRNKNITESDISDLESLGFVVSRHANNHYKLSFREDTRHSFTLPSTSSDVRSMKNSYSDIIKQISVYK